MQTLVLIAVGGFVLGIFVALPYYQAHKRRLALSEEDKNNLAAKRPTLDKPLSSG